MEAFILIFANPLSFILICALLMIPAHPCQRDHTPFLQDNTTTVATPARIEQRPATATAVSVLESLASFDDSDGYDIASENAEAR